MNTAELVIATVEGPKGTALVIEIEAAQDKSLEYQVRYQDYSETFKSMGEAYITAKGKAGVAA